MKPKAANTTALLQSAYGPDGTAEVAITDYLRSYLRTLENIDLEKANLKIIEEEAAQLPGVEKRPFKAICRAMHESVGAIDEKLLNMHAFIRMALCEAEGNQDKIDFN